MRALNHQLDAAHSGPYGTASRRTEARLHALGARAKPACVARAEQRREFIHLARGPHPRTQLTRTEARMYSLGARATPARTARAERRRDCVHLARGPQPRAQLSTNRGTSVCTWRAGHTRARSSRRAEAGVDALGARGTPTRAARAAHRHDCTRLAGGPHTRAQLAPNRATTASAWSAGHTCAHSSRRT